MICTTCGADNASHLTFCQECGQRLAPKVAPPAPPIAPIAAPAGPPPIAGASPKDVVTSPLAATAMSPSVTPSPASGPSPKRRPIAPAVTFPPRVEPPSPPPPLAATVPSPVVAPPVAAPPVAPPPRAAEGAATSVCPQCGGTNQKGMRFCVTCGMVLSGPAPVAAVRKPSAPIDLSKTVPDAPLDNPELAITTPQPQPSPLAIAPARVMDVGTPKEPAIQRMCVRCRGVSEATSQFCRFCGTSLADARAFAAQPPPEPAPPAPRAPAPAPEPAAARNVTPVARIIAAAPPGAPTPVGQPAAMPVPAATPGAPAVSHGAAAASRAAAPSAARLVLIARDGGEGPNFPLGETTDIGRTEGHIVIADDHYISPRHARIAIRRGVFYLRDLESTNGLFVRIPLMRERAGASPQTGLGASAHAQNEASGEQEVTDQDLFLVGQQVLRFEVVKNAEEGFGVASENGTLLFGTPASSRYARLSQRTTEGVVRDVFHVRKMETVIGREQGDIVFSDDPFLSRRHCALRVGGVAGARTFTLSDLGSSNGTFLQVRDEVRLRHGDHFRIGQQLFRFDT